MTLANCHAHVPKRYVRMALDRYASMPITRTSWPRARVPDATVIVRSGEAWLAFQNAIERLNRGS